MSQTESLRAILRLREAASNDAKVALGRAIAELDRVELECSAARTVLDRELRAIEALLARPVLDLPAVLLRREGLAAFERRLAAIEKDTAAARARVASRRKELETALKEQKAASELLARRQGEIDTETRRRETHVQDDVHTTRAARTTGDH